MPREGRFFELFARHSLVVVSGAEALRAMLDGGDIQALISRMDDSIDQMKTTAKAIATYEMREFAPGMRLMGDAVVRCAGLVRDAVPLLSNVGRNAARIGE